MYPLLSEPVGRKTKAIHGQIQRDLWKQTFSCLSNDVAATHFKYSFIYDGKLFYLIYLLRLTTQLQEE